MTWEIRNVGWPVPYTTHDYWPLAKPKQLVNPYLFEYRDKEYIQPYGHTYYPTENYKGKTINQWV